MRPTRLDLEGFASFRQPTTLDFTDADLFVLSGPTGAGKSSLIDAMTFALYGVVARYGDKRLVAPVISNGRNEARVRLQFRVGAQAYTAVRVVRRTQAGASTKEARLECWRGDDPADAVVLAATADEVSDEVVRVLGLGYEHFTTTVVLPQGAFQRFLHARASERQGLLVELLDLAVFGRIGQLARTKASAADARAQTLAQQLDAAADRATDDAVDAAGRRSDGLARAIEVIDRARPELDEILDRGRRQADRARELSAQRDALEAVEPPGDLDALGSRLDTATADAKAARAVLQEARARRRDLDETVDELPSADAVRAQQRHLQRRAELRDQLAEASGASETAAAAREDTEQAASDAGTRLEAARSELEGAQRADLVATLVADTQAGDPCPICRRPLEDDVEVNDEVLAHARQAVATAEQALDQARRAATRASAEASRAEERRLQLQDQATRLDEELAAADLPGRSEDLATLEDEVGAAIDRRRQARAAEAAADADATKADEELTAARRGLESARTVLDTTRDGLAALSPPPLPRDEPVAAWERLLAWVAEQRPAAAERVAAAEQATETARVHYAEGLASLRAELGEHDVDTARINQAGPLRDAFVAAHATATNHHDRLVELREDNRRKQEDLAATRRDAAIATELGRLLNRNNFEQWLLARAVNRLVAGASEHLQDLTGGAYTLRLEPDGSFGILDHANGGEVRSARTLSGGETFLASLSLALALSDHVADFAAEGAARLESLFIDEGFGTLDAATIDIVRTALEELGSTGRMVGVVTHVQALAEQLPVQFHVRKESQTSVVERVNA